ncbi:hypothetical protein FA13DRAFT_1870785 [Coprinellus micaceus]|uniref:Uncharacterized protein n=1 Tax=Coprinellus micaceus TaxID=71717 RepID=A0A4Y7S828_COPMI|nr:hypothetical protein FA13DRAFT_1870785 [Coprinellus micaceus]
MQGLQRALRTLSLSGGQKVFPGMNRTVLLDQRIFYVAPKEAIEDVAAVLTAYIFGGLHRGKDGFYDLFGWETLKRRVSEVIDILFNDDQYLRIEFSRTQACIAREVFERIRREYGHLSPVFVLRLDADVTSKFNDAWKHVENGHVDPEYLERLQARTAIFADLHAKTIGGLDLTRALNSILAKITTPELFDLLLFAFLSRALTDTGVKLWTESWKQIIAQVDVKIPASSWEGSSYESVWSVIEMFREDSENILDVCRVPWREVQDSQDWELRGLCDAIRHRVQGGVDVVEGSAFGMDVS